jgi:hypothetical protein
MSNERETINSQSMHQRSKRIMLKSKFAHDLHEIYLDYFNNFLTVEYFSEYYGISLEFANALIKEAKRLEDENN